jgi:hypothetical protein
MTKRSVSGLGYWPALIIGSGRSPACQLVPHGEGYPPPGNNNDDRTPRRFLDEFLITNIPPNTTSIDRVSLWLKRHAIAASIIVFACALSTRLFFTLRSDQYSLVKETPDAASYLVPAQNLLKQGSFLNRYDYPEISRTPGYSTFLAGIMLVVGQDWRKVLLTQTILVSFSVLVSFWTAATIFSPAGAFIGALFAALSPWGAVRAGLPLTEGLYLLIISLLFFL